MKKQKVALFKTLRHQTELGLDLKKIRQFPDVSRYFSSISSFFREIANLANKSKWKLRRFSLIKINVAISICTDKVCFCWFWRVFFYDEINTFLFLTNLQWLRWQWIDFSNFKIFHFSLKEFLTPIFAEWLTGLKNLTWYHEKNVKIFKFNNGNQGFWSPWLSFCEFFIKDAWEKLWKISEKTSVIKLSVEKVKNRSWS